MEPALQYELQRHTRGRERRAVRPDQQGVKVGAIERARAIVA